MTRTEIKYKAQDEILSMIQCSFTSFSERSVLDDCDKKMVLEEMSKQMARVEKLFGYSGHEWMRSC